MSVRDPEVLDVDADVDAPEPSRRPIVAGVAAGLWSLLVGVALVTCLVMLAWALSPHSVGDSAAAWRAAGSVWLGAHQVPLEIGGRDLTLLPLGALLLGLLLTRRSGRWAGRLLAGTSVGEAVAIVTSCALVYGTGGAGVAWLAAGPGTGASPPSAFLWTGAVALVGATWGIAREAELVAWARSRVSDAAWRTALGGLAAVVALLGVGALLVTVSLVRHFSQITATLTDLDAGPVGELALTVLGVLCLPTLDIWAMAVVVGPGFDLGSSGGLDILGGQVESLPALPVLAAVPTTVPAWGPVLLLVPVVCGVLAGRIRWGRDLPTLTGAALSGAGLAGVVAALVGGLSLLAAGSLGGGRLAEVGPRAVPVAAAAAGLVLLGFLAEAAFQSLKLSWELHRAEQRAEDRRLRRAARGLVDPVEPSDVPVVGGPEVEGLGAVRDAAEVAAVAEAGDDRPAEAPPRREPPPARQSLVIPVVVPIPLVDPLHQEDVSAADHVTGQADRSDMQTPHSEVAVDLTAVTDPDPVLQ
ncbi:MAG TPA: DUF6350 family protein, partial [Candidatus Limnocylindrales bacterium]|nr:DUF6350 family protein [Candidatus Limnocylindrales bacterium]